MSLFAPPLQVPLTGMMHDEIHQESRSKNKSRKRANAALYHEIYSEFEIASGRANGAQFS